MQRRCDQHKGPALGSEFGFEHVGAVYWPENALIVGAPLEWQSHLQGVSAGVGEEWVFGCDLDLRVGWEHGLSAVDIKVCHARRFYFLSVNFLNLSS